jgi:hypothetical protein
MVDEFERFEQLVRVFKAKMDMGPKIKFGVKVPKNATHAIRLDRKNGNRLWQDSTDIELYIRSTSTRPFAYQNPTKTCRNMSTFHTISFSIANLMEDERVDSLPGGLDNTYKGRYLFWRDRDGYGTIGFCHWIYSRTPSMCSRYRKCIYIWKKRKNWYTSLLDLNWQTSRKIADCR